MATEAEKQWEGRAIAKITGYPAAQVWPLLEDFFSLHSWMPLTETCYGVEGTSGQLGCVRYCATTQSIRGGSEEEKVTVTKWALEKLVAIDPITRSVSYEVLDNNVGYNSYKATMQLLPCESCSEGEDCELVWSFVVDPVEGWKLEDLVSFYDSSLQAMAEQAKVVLGGAAKQN